ncbi:hypothetical protein SAMN02982989_3202 [Xaviernesmea oryzae]|uniref:RNA polymerase alpha subunit n=1 Tax=Xaviernesmea oryzae TaxID=464029 RepID=A0A1X7FL40_9HYPH|nr:hypothetical protein SAMN02982989_3202 [Xaviernesmea oryzae]
MRRNYRFTNFDDYIDNSDLPERLISILERSGFERLSTLTRLSDVELLLLPNIGPHYVAEIRRVAPCSCTGGLL